MPSQQGNKTAKAFKFIVDDAHFETDEQDLTGAQLRVIANIDPSLQLFEEVQGKGADRPIEDQTQVTLREHGQTRFYTMPRANLG
jgi:hypothetical protein